MPGKITRLFITLVALLSFILCTEAPPCYPKTGDAGTPPAAVNYYDDAQGAFMLKPPPSAVGSQLRLAGTCIFAELSVQIQNRSAHGPARQAVYRTGGKKSFDFNYLIKDGSGDYEVTIFGRKTTADLEMRGLCYFHVRSAEDPSKKSGNRDINDCIMSYVNSVMGKTVGRGECWDLAQEALDGCGADWNRPWIFGTLLDPDKDTVKPGDIIQFKSVKLVEKFPDGGTKWQVFGAPDHTAVISAVQGLRQYTLAHQNTEGKRFVIVSSVNLNLMTSGRYRIYRPVAGIIR
jgi:hypothetical protein